MKFIFPVGLLLILTSCFTVSFNQPQPKNGQRLKEFPEELRGKWTADDGDLFAIDATGTGNWTLITDSLGNVLDTSYRYQPLSDTMRIYQGGNYYVYNELSTNGSWKFAVAKVDSKGNIYTYFCDDFKFYSKLKGLKIDSASYTVQHYLHEIDSLITLDTIVYNPSAKELSTINSDEVHWVSFNGQIRIKDLKKIAVPKNLISIYKIDGTVEVKVLEPDTEEEGLPED